MLKYPRTSSSTSSGYYDDDEALMNPYQTPPASPQSVPQYLQRHMVRMFSTEEWVKYIYRKPPSIMINDRTEINSKLVKVFF